MKKVCLVIMLIVGLAIMTGCAAKERITYIDWSKTETRQTEEVISEKILGEKVIYSSDIVIDWTPINNGSGLPLYRGTINGQEVIQSKEAWQEELGNQ